MHVTRWLKLRTTADNETQIAPDVSSAAARGASLEKLSKVAVRALLAAGHADRAGVWIAGPDRAADWCGYIEEKSGDATPALWTRVSPTAPFIGRMIEKGEPFFQNFSDKLEVVTFGPMIGIGAALWLPLRAGSRLLGLAFAAWKRTRSSPVFTPFLRIADQLSVAAAGIADAYVAHLRQSELISLDQIQKAIAEGISADESLQLILCHTKRFTGCCFVALGVEHDGKISCQLVAGSSKQPVSFHLDPLKEAWIRSLAQNRAVDIRDFAGPGSLSSLSFLPATSILAVPLRTSMGMGLSTLPGNLCGATQARLGVLLAAFVPGTETPQDRQRLEACASLAALSLQVHSQRQWEDENKLSYASFLAKTSEWILLVNDLGIICGGSKAAFQKLAGTGFFTVPRRLHDLFMEDACQPLTEWCKAGLSGTPGTLEATLVSGAMVQIRVRSAPFSSQPGPRWEILLEARSQDEDFSRPAGSVIREFETLLDSLDTGVLLFDAAQQLRMVNHRFSQFFGMDLGHVRAIENREALAARLAEHSQNPEAFRARWREIARSGDVASWDEFELVRPIRRVIERFARPVLDANATPAGWLEVWRDVTAPRLHQAKLQQTEKMAALGQLVSSIAHELNNPLTSIMGYAQLLFVRTRGSELNADLAKIQDEAERASRIIKNLLLRAREHSSQRELVDLNQVVQRTLAPRTDELKLKRIAVEYDLHPNLLLVLADAGQMQQVVLNLVLNAEQAISLSRDQGRISIRTRNAADNRVTLEVADDGPGVPAAINARVFDPFFTTKAAGTGTGLGLSIVTGIVQAHGGSIHLASTPGSGATFEVQLPPAPPRRAEGPNLPTPPMEEVRRETLSRSAARASHVRGRAKYLLVVEDEPTVAQLIADVLRAQGHRVTVVLDSREGLNLTEREKFDLVICDLKMPHLDGRAFYHSLMRAGSPLQNRIIFVTGDTMAPQTMEFLEAYRLPYLAKPFLVDELKNAVEHVFRPAPQRARAASSSSSGSVGNDNPRGTVGKN